MTFIEQKIAVGVLAVVVFFLLQQMMKGS